MAAIDVAWSRIVAHQGKTFHQKRGKPFTYRVSGGAVHPDTTNHSIMQSQFAKALDRMPLDGPGEINDLRGPSYIFAILTDPRINGS
jgi:hypothetical protein